MSGARSANRFRLMALVALTVLLALGSFWILEAMRRDGGESLPAAPRSEPDYSVEKFNLIRMSASGQARYHITGAKLTHYPQQDAYEIQRPILKSFSSEHPPMTLRAERATTDRDNSKVHMYQDVHMDRPAAGKSEHFHLKSEYLLILPDDDTMQTDQAVDITYGTTTLSGIGLHANNATREFHLSNRVRGTYQSAPH